MTYDKFQPEYGFEALGPTPAETHPPKKLACGSCPVSLWRYQDDNNLDGIRLGSGPKHLPYRLLCRCLQTSEPIWMTGQTHLITKCTAKTRALVELEAEASLSA